MPTSMCFTNYRSSGCKKEQQFQKFWKIPKNTPVVEYDISKLLSRLLYRATRNKGISIKESTTLGTKFNNTDI